MVKCRNYSVIENRNRLNSETLFLLEYMNIDYFQNGIRDRFNVLLQHDSCISVYIIRRIKNYINSRIPRRIHSQESVQKCSMALRKSPCTVAIISFLTATLT